MRGRGKALPACGGSWQSRIPRKLQRGGRDQDRRSGRSAIETAPGISAQSELSWITDHPRADYIVQIKKIEIKFGDMQSRRWPIVAPAACSCIGATNSP